MAPKLITDPSTNAPVRCLKVLCEDGRRRSATFTTKARNGFRMPACVKVGSVWVSGWVEDDDEGDFLFLADPAGKNASLLPGKGTR